jgi:hypothetical protein
LFRPAAEVVVAIPVALVVMSAEEIAAANTAAPKTALPESKSRDFQASFLAAPVVTFKVISHCSWLWLCTWRPETGAPEVLVESVDLSRSRLHQVACPTAQIPRRWMRSLPTGQAICRYRTSCRKSCGPGGIGEDLACTALGRSRHYGLHLEVHA